MVGTTVIWVTPSLPIAASTAAGSKPSWITTPAPASKAGNGWIFSPPTWNSGRMFSTRSSGVIA